jgi:hypothetical protein
MPIDQNNSNEDQSAESKISRLLGESPGLGEAANHFAEAGDTGA